MKVIFLIGVSGAGKSTYRNNFLKKNSNFLLVSRDNIRKSLFGDNFTSNGYYKSTDLGEKEFLVSSIQDYIIALSVLKEYDLFVENTNLKESDVNATLNKLPADVDIEFIFIETAGGILINKQRILTRDFNITKHEVDYFRLMEMKDVDYIDKQYRQYENIFNRVKKLGLKHQIIKT